MRLLLRCSQLAAFGLALAATAAVAQQVALQVGTAKIQANGQGECKVSPQASIYGVNAALYRVAQRAAGQSVNLTVWQPKDASAAMMSLSISVGSRQYQVDTVKAGTKRDTKGSGKVTLQASGAGGTFVIEAVAASGEKIAGKVTCGRFDALQAEGG